MFTCRQMRQTRDLVRQCTTATTVCAIPHQVLEIDAYPCFRRVLTLARRYPRTA